MKDLKELYLEYINSIIINFNIDDIISFRNAVSILIKEKQEKNIDAQEEFNEKFFMIILHFSSLTEEEIEEKIANEFGLLIKLSEENNQLAIGIRNKE